MDEERYFRFRVSSGEAVLISFENPEEGEAPAHIEIPAFYEGFPVTEVGSYAFYENGAGIESVRVPSSVRRILPHAFELCISLKELILEDGVEEIGEDALAGTALESLALPPSVRIFRSASSIPCRVVCDPGNDTFSSDGYGLYEKDVLVSVNPQDDRSFYRIREGTVSIAAGVFDDREYPEKVILPTSLRDLPEGLFSNIRSEYSALKGIVSIETDPGNPVFFSDDNAFYRKIPGGVKLLRWLCDEEEVHLPGNVREIGREAFSGKKIRRTELPERISRIAPDAFRGCALLEVSQRNTSFRIVFPKGNPYLLKDLLRGFGRRGLLYDFSGYDERIKEWFPDIDKVEMMLMRLSFDTDLSDAVRETVREHLSVHIREAVRIISDEKRMDLLELLAEQGMISAENAAYLTDYLSRRGKKEMAAFIMSWKHGRIPEKEFDFEL